MSVVIFAYNAVNEHSHIASTQHSANLPTRLMKSRHESHHRYCLLSPFTCFQFLLLFSFFLLFFHQLIPVLNFIHRYGPSQDIQHTKKVLMLHTCDLIYIQTSPYSLLSSLKPPSHEKMRGKHNPIAVWPSLLLFFVLFRPSAHSLSVPGHFSFSENFCSKMRKKSLKKFVQIGLN